MNIPISDDQLQAVIGAAVLQAISQESRDTIIQEAITYLLKPKGDGYSTRNAKSPLQEAFENAIEIYARRTIYEWLEADVEAQEQIRSLYIAAYQKMVQGYAPDFIDRVAQRMARALIDER